MNWAVGAEVEVGEPLEASGVTSVGGAGDSGRRFASV